MSLRYAALVLTLLSATACAQTFDATTLGVPVTMAASPTDQPVGANLPGASRDDATVAASVTIQEQINAYKLLSTQLDAAIRQLTNRMAEIRREHPGVGDLR